MAAMRVFVSHSHVDNDFCRAFVASLRRELYDRNAVWYDEHNLGWGALRQVIERELRACQHFIAILSPAAVTSEWVNAEIDAALAMLNAGVVITFQIVTAVPCEVPLLLQRYKRIERSDGTGYPPAEAAKRALAAIDDKSLTDPGVPPAQDLRTRSSP